VSGELAAMAARTEDATRRVTDARAQLATRQQAVVGWREQVAHGERNHTELAVRATQAAERSRAAETARGVAVGVVVELEERLRETEALRLEGGEGVTTATREQQTADEARVEATERGGRLSDERNRLAEEIAAADRQLSAEDREDREARATIETLREQRTERDRVVTERRFAIDGLRERLLERYAVGLEALAEAQGEPDVLVDGDEAARAEEIRARIVRLGDLNPGAMAEYEEVRERHQFLTQQRTDLEKSLEDLRQTIAKLTRTSRQRFDETFEAANAKLCEVFPKVFPGGIARLELVPGEEGAEAGVEISVQLSGKKLQTLSLLSGGEKALTATALVFSLFLIRPTPFCLLDEVDAPLDEANIGRFNSIVQDMAETSQFVLITHNRRTMEAAETLYGITMEKPGVSKVVSVRLREAA